MFSVGTATGDTHYMLVSDHQRENFLTPRSPPTNLDPEKIYRVKDHSVRCPNCTLTVMVKPDDKVCPVCGSALLIPEKR
jgi:DNA-directed RNA polymerase subunit RPC12/RpoP